MLAKKYLRDPLLCAQLQSSLHKRNITNIELAALQQADANHLALVQKTNELNTQRNQLAAQITQLVKKNNNQTTNQNELATLKQAMQDLNTQIAATKVLVQQAQTTFETAWAQVPNLVAETVPLGLDETANMVVATHGTTKPQPKGFLPHWELAVRKGWCDYQAAANMSGARFVVYKGLGAQLIRALQAYTLSMHEQAGYLEYFLPVLVTNKSLFHTGQLPKFAKDLFALANSNLYLSSTLEVQLVNLFANQILPASQLPIKVMASGVNFRKEAGAAGKDNRGNIRLHQFVKTELVNLTTPEQSATALEAMCAQAGKILASLQLPYRQIILCGGDLGFSAAMTYDLEVWLPSYANYKEISSCSNCYEFQANRAFIRYKNEQRQNQKAMPVHTLNGTGVAIDRLFAALVENHQTDSGDVLIPTALQPYFPHPKI